MDKRYIDLVKELKENSKLNNEQIKVIVKLIRDVEQVNNLAFIRSYVQNVGFDLDEEITIIFFDDMRQTSVEINELDYERYTEQNYEDLLHELLLDSTL